MRAIPGLTQLQIDYQRRYDYAVVIVVAVLNFIILVLISYVVTL